MLWIDKAAGNKKWQEAVMKEIAALIHHKCFEFKSTKFMPSADYQYALLCLVYDIKSDLCYKARLVVQGHRVDPRGLSTRATVVKGILVRLLDVIAHHQGLQVLIGDVGNVFIQVFTKEKYYTHLGAEFGERAGMIAIIVCALYDLTTSAERYRTLFADFLHGLGFVPTCYDRDVWMRLRESGDGYDYICTHVDDFKIVAKDPKHWMEMIKGTFLVKESGERDYYLGNNYKYHAVHDVWTMGSPTFALESIRCVKSVHGV
jgi:Reverse transcriptase (RNA-dependent DNA polymerase).